MRGRMFQVRSLLLEHHPAQAAGLRAGQLLQDPVVPATALCQTAAAVLVSGIHCGSGRRCQASLEAPRILPPVSCLMCCSSKDSFSSTGALCAPVSSAWVCAGAAMSAEEGRLPAGNLSLQTSGCRASASSSDLEQVPGADSSCGSCSAATSRCSTAASIAAHGPPPPEQLAAAGRKEPSDEGSAGGAASCEAGGSLHRQSSSGSPGLAATSGGCKHELEGPPATVAGQGCIHRPGLVSSGSLDSSRCGYSMQAAAGAPASSAAQAAQRPSAVERGVEGHICDAGPSMSAQHGGGRPALSAAMQSLHMPTAGLPPAAAFHARRHLLARSIEGRRIDMVTITGPEEPGAAIADRPVRFFSLLSRHPCIPSELVIQGKAALLGLPPSQYFSCSACCVACPGESFHSCLGCGGFHQEHFLPPAALLCDCPSIAPAAPGTGHLILSSMQVIFVSARVHPCETPSSHMMAGMLELLLHPRDCCAAALRRQFILQLVPMLNPDGVANVSPYNSWPSPLS